MKLIFTEQKNFTEQQVQDLFLSAQLLKVAERLAGQYGVRFLYRDFRPNFREGNRRARELGFYMQKYCGCVFSEQERYQKQIDRDKAAFAGS